MPFLLLLVLKWQKILQEFLRQMQKLPQDKGLKIRSYYSYGSEQNSNDFVDSFRRGSAKSKQ
ncbi:MAG: hypothetical protein K2P17_03310 [Helicobacteraceae bacterium]|nr:hypothetical protein [Helicobacteraceae bacterium]